MKKKLTPLCPRVELGLAACNFFSATRIGFNGTGLSLDIFGTGLSFDIFGTDFSFDNFVAGFSLGVFGATLPTGGGWLVGIGGSLVRAGLPEGGLKEKQDWLRPFSRLQL